MKKITYDPKELEMIFWEKPKNPIPPEIFFSMKYLAESATEIDPPMEIKTKQDVDRFVIKVKRAFYT